jgi:acyl carrier protein
MKIEVDKLQEIFHAAMDTDAPININTTRDNCESWDSINHLNLIVELEDVLNVSFTKEEIENMCSVNELIKILGGK